MIDDYLMNELSNCISDLILKDGVFIDELSIEPMVFGIAIRHRGKTIYWLKHNSLNIVSLKFELFWHFNRIKLF
jgi:hypothetical protein